MKIIVKKIEIPAYYEEAVIDTDDLIADEILTEDDVIDLCRHPEDIFDFVKESEMYFELENDGKTFPDYRYEVRVSKRYE